VNASTHSTRPSIYTRPFIFTALANFLLFCNLNVFTLLPLHIQQLGGREGTIGAIMAMYSGAAILCNLAIGSPMDRFGRRPFLVAAAGLATLVSVAFALSGGLGWHFFALRFLQGVAVAAFTVGNLTLLADLVPSSRRAEAVGVFGVSGLVTIALAPAAGELVVRAWGFRTLFAGSALLGVGALLMIWAVRVPPPAEREGSGRLGAGFLRAFFPVLMAGLQFGLAHAAIFVFLPPFVRAIGLPRVGPFYIVYTVMAVAVRFCGGGLADRLGRRQIILPSLVALALGVLLLGATNSTPLLLLVAFVNGTAHGFVFPATSALALDLAPPGARGKALALFNVAGLVGMMAGAFGLGWLAQQIGYRPAFMSLGGLLLLGTLLVWRR